MDPVPRDEHHLGHPLPDDQDRRRGCVGSGAGVHSGRGRCSSAASAGVVATDGDHRAEPLEGVGGFRVLRDARRVVAAVGRRTPPHQFDDRSSHRRGAHHRRGAGSSHRRRAARRKTDPRSRRRHRRRGGSGGPAHRRQHVAHHRGAVGGDVLRDRTADRRAPPGGRPGAPDDGRVSGIRRRGLRGACRRDLA